MTELEERAVIQKVIGGDRNAFERLVLDNQGKVYGLALKMTANESDACELAQDAFLKAYTNLAAFRGGSRFSVWLYRLTYNLCVDFLRRKKRAGETPLSLDAEEGGAEADIPDARGNPEDALLRRETRALLDRGLGTLPPGHREVLLLREAAGLSYAEIAETVGVPEGTVKSRIARARRSLAEFLNQNGTFSEKSRHKNGEEAQGYGL
ncbi:MAG: sigma-70 family RNA polymerase sigma factor [Oscillospiraceae bacterium]|nr:sigma-70 family RNA polymerase sigma factor [Oscillospiraceae bacterium]